MRNTQALELPVRARAEFLFRSRPKNLLTLTRESLKLYEEISPSLQPDVKFQKNGRLLVAPNEAEIGFVETRAVFLQNWVSGLDISRVANCGRWNPTWGGML